ncbi:carbon-nitrogen hydrolase family protein [Mycobacterium sp. C31M]
MRIALAQIRSGTDPTANLELVEDYSRHAADAGAELVLFPEATMCRFGVPLAPVAQPRDGRWADGVRRVATATGITVVAGMFCPSGDGRVTNTLIAAGPDVDAYYDKIHLYDAFGFAESKTVAPGSEPTVIEVNGVRVGLTLCYDVRFPELYLDLADRGAQLITVHASWGTGPGKLDQWTLLARARAIDTTGIVAAVDQAYPGDEIAAKGPTGVGGSLIASATGQILAAAEADPQLVVADIDLDGAAEARETIAVLRNRTQFAKAQSNP